MTNYQERLAVRDERGRLHAWPGESAVECAFELGDWRSYVSAGRDALAASCEVRSSTTTETSFAAEHRVHLASGTVRVDQTERITGRRLGRDLTVTAETPVTIGDVVVRFVVSESAFDEAVIAGRRVSHTGANRYLQYPTDTVRLDGPAGTLTVRATETRPGPFAFRSYVRDEPGKWVVHLRLIALDGDDGFLRFYVGPVVQYRPLDVAVSRVGPVRDVLTYCRERLSRYPALPLVPFQWVRTVALDPGETVGISAEARID